ncbi:hypothetical protein QJS10_CPA08g01391 [Acorus calamus]|uniref:PHD-type domain-containing protein n=1 Tax=Acorus calamus TaxID=4465 RepID=A0AAV9EAG4_ACOCL|nr:hypothetical protein QJS10_CPA08g01391 [Acorus calamus]
MDPPHTGFRPNGSFLVLNLGTNTFGIGGPNAGTPPNPEASDGPPKYLVDLLERFGWRVVARPGSDECSYVAPTGFVYPSLPKVLESLMSGGSASRGASLTAFDDGLGPFGAGPGLRGVVGLRNSSGDSVLVKPVVSDSVGGVIGDEKVESLMGIGRQSDELNGFRRSERIKGRRVPMESIADVESSDDCLSLEEGASALNCDDVNVIRRSGRINGKRVPVDNDSDVEIGGFCLDDDDEYLELPKWVDNGERKKKSKAIASIIAELDGEMFVEADGLWKENVEKECVYRKTRSQKHIGDKDSIPKKCSPSSKRKSVRCGNSRNKRKKRRSGGCGLMVRRKEKFDGDEEMLDGGKVSVFSWLIDTGILVENEKVFYKMKNDKRSSWKGCVTRDGVRCDCCKKFVLLLKSKAHRGRYLCEPWLNTRLVSGKSLMECQRQAWEKEKKLRNVGFQNVGVDDLDPTDDTCGVCADGGHLIICDGCPSTFHKDCLLLKALPEDSWYCPYCRCTFCGLAEHGPERARAFLTIFTCYQCGKKYHRECAWGNDINELGPESSPYCGKSCEKVAAGLTLIVGTLNSVGDGFTWTLLKRLDEDTEGISEQNRFLYCERQISSA